MHRLKSVERLADILKDLPSEEERINFVIFLCQYSYSNFLPIEEISDYMQICIDNYVNYIDVDDEGVVS